ncbi:hypothetical protein [Microbulbifer sp. HZ11]|uniref:hypothetical protein n=1 Tax=Microbulbifer sp. HZ11 TaxID=1453501 RepID=UPI0005BBF3DD|nr:hypothetical protein [Microbulbifer sp. HZ11]
MANRAGRYFQKRLGKPRLSRLVLAWTLLAFPAAFANESLDEDFLLFLSDWTDDTGEFVSPSDMDESWAGASVYAEPQSPQAPSQQAADAEQGEQNKQGEPDE